MRVTLPLLLPLLLQPVGVGLVFFSLLRETSLQHVSCVIHLFLKPCDLFLQGCLLGRQLSFEKIRFRLRLVQLLLLVLQLKGSGFKTLLGSKKPGVPFPDLTSPPILAPAKDVFSLARLTRRGGLFRHGLRSRFASGRCSGGTRSRSGRFLLKFLFLDLIEILSGIWVGSSAKWMVPFSSTHR